MQPLFAHHDMLEALDVLGINPVTPMDHALALSAYALLAFALFVGLRWAGRGIARRARSTQTASEPLPALTPRTLEG